MILRYSMLMHNWNRVMRKIIKVKKNARFLCLSEKWYTGRPQIHWLSIIFYFLTAGNGGISHLRQINVLGQDILTSHINPRFHATKHCFGAREFHKKDNLA